MTARIVAAARSIPGGIFAAACGIAAVALILRGIGLTLVGQALAGAARYVPLVLLLEAAIVVCSLRALRSLYGTAAAAVPPWQLVRAGLIGYAVAGLVPAGRAFGEATRASLLARWVGAARASAAAARLQAVALIANGLISIPAAVAATCAVGWSWLPLAIAINAGVTLALGTALLCLARRSRVGAWLARRFRRAHLFGVELDACLAREPALPARAIAWELAGRTVQVVQQLVLLACVGGALGLRAALCAEGIHLVGAAVGDLVPAQLGATEGNFTLAAGALGLSAASAVSIALLAHVAQLAWVAVGALAPLFGRPVSQTSAARSGKEPS